jgi:hypothetical protein
MSYVLFCLSALLLPACARANFLTYLDENGTKHIVQSESEIPEKYRNKVKVSKAGNPEGLHAGATATATAVANPAPAIAAPAGPSDEVLQLQGQLSQVLALQQAQEQRRLDQIEHAQAYKDQAAAAAKARAAMPPPVVKVGR